MKLIYKYPLICSIIINILLLGIISYLCKYNYLFGIAIPFTGVLNRKILINGVEMNNKKKVVIIAEYTVSLIVFITYNTIILLNNM
ncbi:hypothetical protein [Clostridium sp.]|uniref:hypothetical protein n=1 Tax=Clostridium sp. TaxID=1506 RepID=UPI0025C6F82C|nr:hypothetical protein [Clostridium sp.]